MGGASFYVLINEIFTYRKKGRDRRNSSTNTIEEEIKWKGKQKLCQDKSMSLVKMVLANAFFCKEVSTMNWPSAGLVNVLVF